MIWVLAFLGLIVGLFTFAVWAILHAGSIEDDNVQ